MTLRNFDLDRTVPLSDIHELLDSNIDWYSEQTASLAPAEIVLLLEDIKRALHLIGMDA